MNKDLIIVVLAGYIVVSHFGAAVVLNWLHKRLQTLETKFSFGAKPHQ